MRERLAAASFFPKGTERSTVPFGKEESMKKQLLRTLCLGLLVLLFSACAKKHNTNNNDNAYYGGDPMDFKSFQLVQTDMTAQRRVYEGYKTENGVHLEYYISTEMWDDKTSGNVECRNVVRAIDADESVFQKLCALFGNYRIAEWAGFRGHDSQALDGTGMSFEAVLADGTQVNANGINSFPKNYSSFAQELCKLITTEKISSVQFSEGTYEITLPESWVGTVTASFSENQVAFYVDKTDGGNLTFFIIDNDTYGYSSDSYKGRIEVGRLVSDEDVRFITARDNYSIASYAKSVSEEAVAIWKNYENDKLAIIESLRGVNGYAFSPEDGTVLYYADAREMLMQELDDCQIVISESPDSTPEWCKMHQPDVLLMEVKAFSPWMFSERMAIRDKVKRSTENCRVVLFVDDESNKNLTEEVQQAKREGLIDAFLFDSVSENYFASVIDSV